MPLFSMGRDIPDGNMTLTDDGFLDLDWRTRRSNAVLRAGARDGPGHRGRARREVPGQPALAPRAASSPCTRSAAARWGSNEREGVVDSYGRVFGYPGLLIADGSVMPGPVGPNPSNTIAALAHRAAEQVIREAG